MIDGSNAGAQANGLVLVADDVHVSGLTIKNFSGDGIVIRGSDAALTWITSTNNVNGIRLECRHADIRGSQFSANARNGIWITPSSGGNQIGVPDHSLICPECVPAPAGDLVSGNGGAGILIDGSENIIDTAWVTANGGDGIMVNGAHNAVINSSISNNVAQGVALRAPARFVGNTGGCNDGGFINGGVLDPPSIEHVRSDPTVVTANGTVHGAPNTNYAVELNEVAACSTKKMTLLGSTSVTTDAAGFASWTALLPHNPVTGLFAMATRGEAEQTSRPSPTVAAFVSGETRVDLAARTTAPPAALPNQEIEFVTVVTNNGPAAVDSFEVEIRHTQGTSYLSASTTSGACYLGGVEFCVINVLAPGESATIRERVKVFATTGTLRHVATASHWAGAPLIDPDRSNDTAVVSVPVVSARHRPAQH